MFDSQQSSPLGKGYTDVILTLVLTLVLPWPSWRVIRSDGEKNIVCVLTRRCQVPGKPPCSHSSYVDSSIHCINSLRWIETGTAHRLCLAGHKRRWCECSSWLAIEGTSIVLRRHPVECCKQLDFRGNTYESCSCARYQDVVRFQICKTEGSALYNKKSAVLEERRPDCIQFDAHRSPEDVLPEPREPPASGRNVVTSFAQVRAGLRVGHARVRRASRGRRCPCTRTPPCADR